MIPVAFNDVAFSFHAVLMGAFTSYQIATYEVSVSLHRVYNHSFLYVEESDVNDFVIVPYFLIFPYVVALYI